MFVFPTASSCSGYGEWDSWLNPTNSLVRNLSKLIDRVSEEPNQKPELYYEQSEKCYVRIF